MARPRAGGRDTGPATRTRRRRRHGRDELVPARRGTPSPPPRPPRSRSQSPPARAGAAANHQEEQGEGLPRFKGRLRGGVGGSGVAEAEFYLVRSRPPARGRAAGGAEARGRRCATLAPGQPLRGTTERAGRPCCAVGLGMPPGCPGVCACSPGRERLHPSGLPGWGGRAELPGLVAEGRG